jgi:hypothetical protein
MDMAEAEGTDLITTSARCLREASELSDRGSATAETADCCCTMSELAGCTYTRPCATKNMLVTKPEPKVQRWLYATHYVVRPDQSKEEQHGAQKDVGDKHENGQAVRLTVVL